jgi:hypothetical protein
MQWQKQVADNKATTNQWMEQQRQAGAGEVMKRLPEGSVQQLDGL